MPMDDLVLQHHGIKGQRWGIRRFQKKDGTLTSSGKKRYSEDSNSIHEQTKSKHRLKLEESYRQKGMGEKDAELAANRRIKIEKVVAATAGLTVAAATAYVVNKNLKERTDKIIKAGTTIQRITSDSDPDIGRPFYAANHKIDKIKYAGKYGKTIMDRDGVMPTKIDIIANKDIKVASRKKAESAFVDLYKNDSEFRKAFKEVNNEFVRNPMVNHRIHNIAAKDMSDKQLRKAGYDAFNRSLVAHNPAGQTMSKKFYDKLKQQGYDAITDINDQKYSGYNAKSPLIVFNTANKVSKHNVETMNRADVNAYLKKARNIEARQIATKEAVAQGSIMVSGIVIGRTATVAYETKAINKYRIEHPNSGMTDQEILKTIYKEDRR